MSSGVTENDQGLRVTAKVPEMQPNVEDAVVTVDKPADKPSPAAGEDAEVSTVSPEEVNTTVEDVARNGCGRNINEHEYNPKTCSKTAFSPNILDRDFCHDKVGALSYGMTRATKKTVDEATRMDLNGETQTMMDHVQKRWKNTCYDTSGDAPWEIDQSLACRDSYVWYWTLVWLGLKLLIFIIPMLFCNILAILPVWLVARRQKAPSDYMERDCFFYIMFFIVSILHLPSMIMLFVALFMDYAVYYFAGFLFTLFRWRWCECWRSHRALDPYRCGPAILSLGAQTDIMVCYAGQTMRHGFIGTAYNVTVMYLIMPWLKYFWNVNPWVYDLSERYVQQISTSMKDLAKMHRNSGEKFVERGICDGARRVISRGKQFAYVRANEDYWNFVPHYPYPPPNRRWAMGLQAGGSCNTPCKFTLLVHATHAISDAGGSKGIRSTEQFVLSNSVHTPVYRVMLWYSNPFHFFTGFVEASISMGGDSQQNKYLGGEHPMWLVTAKSPFLSNRDSMTGVGMIDSFFDNWLPIFVHECRRLAHLDYEMIVEEKSLDEALPKAKAAADAKYQEVLDQDGLSVLHDKKGLEKYKDKDGLNNLTRQLAQKEDGKFEGSVGLFEEYNKLHHSFIMRDYEREKATVDEYVARQREEWKERNANHTSPRHTNHVHSLERDAEAEKESAMLKAQEEAAAAQVDYSII